jgi:hypothetical protein
MTSIVTLTPIQRGIASRIDALDLAPVQYTLTQPEPGQRVTSLLLGGRR